MDLKITLDQWRALIAVVEAGGYAQAAEALDKSQSAISYAIQKLETALDVRVFRLEGRKAALTESGDILYRRAQALVEEAGRLERSAISLARGVEAQLVVAVDAIFPLHILLPCFDAFSHEFPETRIELLETVLSGTDEALLRHEADIAITPRLPAGFLGDILMRARFVAVAHPDHPLHALGRPVTLQDMRHHRQLVVRDSGSRSLDVGWLGAEQRWTVGHQSTSILAATLGLGFAWYPEEKIRDQLNSGTLKPLDMAEGEERFADLHLIFAEGDYVGPAAQRLGEIIRVAVKKLCLEQEHL